MPWILILGGAEGLAALTIGFEIVAGAIVLVMLGMLAKTWLEPLLASTATRRGGGILRILDLPGRAIRSIAASAFSAVTHSISVAATHRMHPLARWFHALGSLALGSAWAVGSFAGDMAWSIERLATVVLPREIRRVTRPISHRATRALTRALAAGLAVTHLRHYVERLWTHTIRPAIRRLEHAVDVTIPRSLSGLRHRVKDVETQLSKPSRRWLRRVAAAMWAVSLGGLMVRTLARRFPWLFCRQVKRTGATICRLDSSLLDWLILGAAASVNPFTLEAFAHEAVEIEGLFTEGLGTLLGDVIDATDDYLGATGGGIPNMFADYLD